MNGENNKKTKLKIVKSNRTFRLNALNAVKSHGEIDDDDEKNYVKYDECSGTIHCIRFCIVRKTFMTEMSVVPKTLETRKLRILSSFDESSRFTGHGHGILFAQGNPTDGDVAIFLRCFAFIVV